MTHLLPVDVSQEGIQLRLPHGKRPVTRLPFEMPRSAGLVLQPDGTGLLHLLDEIRDGDRAAQVDGEMHVIGNAADPEDFAADVSSDCGEVAEQLGSNRRGKGGFAVLG